MSPSVNYTLLVILGCPCLSELEGREEEHARMLLVHFLYCYWLAEILLEVLIAATLSPSNRLSCARSLQHTEGQYRIFFALISLDTQVLKEETLVKSTNVVSILSSWPFNNFAISGKRIGGKRRMGKQHA